MKLSLQGRLVALWLTLLITVGLAVGLGLERRVRTSLESSFEQGLVRQAQVSALLVDGGADREALARAIADRGGSRVTLIDPDGVVVGESERSAAGMNNHADRPEVKSATLGAPGIARRYSETLGQDMLYVAVRQPTGDVVRLAVAVDVLKAEIRRLHIQLLIGGVIALILSSLLAVAATRLILRDLQKVVDETRAVAGTDPMERPPRSIERLSREMTQTVGVVAQRSRLLEAVLAGMSEGVLAVDPASRVALVNEACLELLEQTEVAVGEPLLNSLRLPDIAAAVERALAGESFDVELGLQSGRILNIHAAPQKEGGALLVLHDVTELRRLEAVRTDFVANVSHELRTPVSVVLASSEALTDGAYEDPIHGPRFLDAIRRNAARMGQLITDLLSLSKMESGRLDLASNTLAVHDLVDSVLAGLREKAASRDQSLSNELPAGARVLADASALEQILVNLTDNAVKYTPEGGAVAVKLVDYGDRMRIEVHDNGPGVPPQHRERLFERFYRVDPGRSRAMGGTGLGLAIVKHLAEAMDGQVGMHPRAPTGSVFWVELPADAPERA